MVLTLIIVGWAYLANAQIFGEQIQLSMEAHNQTEALARDVDFDGDLDVIVGSAQGVSWFENQGDGYFIFAEEIDHELITDRNLQYVDLNGDGFEDLLVGNIEELAFPAEYDEVVWYANDGTGNFGPQQLLGTYTAAAIKHISAHDLDNDGDNDLVLGLNFDSFEDELITWFQNNGEGEFLQQAPVSTVALNLVSMAVGDIDGDGLADLLASTSWDDEITAYLNNGNGTFSDGTVIYSTSSNANFSNLRLVDLDLDEDLDLVASAPTIDRMYVLLNNGSGIFGSEQIIDSDANACSHIQTKDLNNNSYPDIIATFEQEENVVYYLNSGDGTFQEGVEWLTNIPESQFVEFGDLDGDEVEDLISVSKSLHQTVWHKRAQAFDLEEPLLVSFAASTAYAMASADMDLDGDIDLVIGEFQTPYAMRWLENDGTGKLTALHLISNEGNSLKDLEVGDINGNGLPDVVGISRFEHEVAWYENAGLGQFEKHIISMTSELAEDVHLADLDLDGDLDVLCASEGDHTIAWFENLGEGVFSEENVLNNQAEEAKGVKTGDIDSDGLMDVISVSSEDNTIEWYRNEGSGVFSAAITIADNYDAAGEVELGDLNGDGTLDVLVGSDSNQENIIWFSNLGGGEFSDAQSVTDYSHWIHDMELLDVDFDDDLDIFVAKGTLNSQPSPVLFIENLGNGTFAEIQEIELELDACFDIHLADMNGDTDAELFAAFGSADIFMMYENMIFYTGINAQEETQVTVFPNPADQEVAVDLSAFQAKFNSWQLVDAQGKVILGSRFNGLKLVIDTAKLPEGMYVLTLTGPNESTSEMLIIQH